MQGGAMTPPYLFFFVLLACVFSCRLVIEVGEALRLDVLFSNRLGLDVFLMLVSHAHTLSLHPAAWVWFVPFVILPSLHHTCIQHHVHH